MLNLIGVVVAFAVIIFLIRKKFNFGISIIIGSLILGLFSLQEMPPINILKAFIEALIYNFENRPFESMFTNFQTSRLDFEAIELAVLMILIFILAKSMQLTGAINKLIDSLRSYFTKGGTIGVIPAVYGLMPVPGGALFSAPLIDEEGKKYSLNQNQKNFLNVWFRNIWFPIYPISSAMILVCSKDFSDIDIYKLIIADFPAFIAFIVIGLIFVKIFIKNNNPKPQTVPKRDNRGLVYLLPPLIPILLYISLFAFGLTDIKYYQKTIFIIGVIISIIVLKFLLKLDWKEYAKIVKKSVSFNLAIAILGILIFREMFEASQANIIIADMISSLNFLPIIIVIIVPMLLGLITGYNLGAIALSYFLVQPLFVYTEINLIGLTSLIFMSSLVGYLISPIHLCNVVSSDYLKTDTTRMYKMYLPAVTMLILVQVVFIGLFYHL